MAEIIKLPLIVIKKRTMIPGQEMQLATGQEETIKAVKEADKKDKLVFLATEYSEKTGDPFPVGTVSRIDKIIETNQGLHVHFTGLYKANIKNIDFDSNPMSAEVKAENREVMEKEAELDPKLCEVIRRELHELTVLYFQALKASPAEKASLAERWEKAETIPEYMELIIGDLPIDYKLKQTFLDFASISPRFELLARAMNDEININRLKTHIEQRVRRAMDKSQKEYVLREQLKVINEEIDGETVESEVDELMSRLDSLMAPKDVKEKIRKEIKRFKKLASNSAEANVSRGYITTLLDIPWEKMSEDNDDIEEVQKILDEDSYGLEKVKERIVEALAVRSITGASDAPIICLVGPPGTGKTSIAQSVAKAMNKEYIRIALGGVRDEADIRGHRRTYIGAMPGRIINGFIDAKVKNPLLLLDEIDKASADQRGDTAAALLEVLDSEQNKNFVDHYVEIPVDLSQVLFIATANDISEMSRPLLDRMEIIEVNSYTENEKMHIAKEYLIPKQFEKNGLDSKQLKITDKAISLIINEYTMEAGVRNLERKIAQICRKAVRKLYDKGFLTDEKITVNQKNIEDFLGKDRIHMPKFTHKPAVGIIHGLAWSSVGGTVMELEVNTMPGRGELVLTGQMGDVMKESAKIALSFVRSIAKGVAKDYFEKTDIHLHIPKGAIPKDGPSAGITMATALFSAVTGRKVDGETAMTGEITLRGLVLPIGGLKEKLLAANKAGMKKVIVPGANKSDVEVLDKEVLGDMEIVFADTMTTVLENAVLPEK